jgi:hypothetical protein
MGNLSQRLKNPGSLNGNVEALIEAVLLDEAAGEGPGTVTSVGLTMPAEFSVANSPITGAGTLAVTKATQTANKVFGGPATGSPAAPTFRSLVAADLPLGTDAAPGALQGDGSTIVVTAGVATAVAGVPVAPAVIYSAAGTPLPAASDALLGATAIVSDAKIPTYLGAYVSGGAVVARVLCTGLAGGWVTG